MINELQNNLRFALRKEYFGGILLDYHEHNFNILSPEEFVFIKRLMDGEKCVFDKKFKIFLNEFNKKNIISLSDNDEVILLCEIRRIIEPLKMTKNHLSAPLKVYDTYTKKCNLACKHCYASSSAALNEKRRTILQTRSIMQKFYDVGVMEWNFTGGEPTIADDLLEAIKIAKSFNMKISLNTNGCWNFIFSKKLLNTKIDNLIISLDGCEKFHDKRRGTGVFKRVIKTLDVIYEYNKNVDNPTNVTINVVISKENINDVDFLISLASNYGYDIKFVPLKPAGRADKNLMLSIDEYMFFVKKLQASRKIFNNIKILLNHCDLFLEKDKNVSKLPYPFNFSQCSALSTAMDIGPSGETFACSFIMDKNDFKGLNILDNSIYEAWEHPNMNNFRNLYGDKCFDCNFYMKKCRGICRSNVLLINDLKGNNMEEKNDPYCFKDLL